MKRYRTVIAALLTTTALLTAPAEAAPPGDRDVIANLWSWNWNSVARECTGHLGPAGYGGVQVSPPQDSLNRAGAVWWDIYQPANYGLTSKFGTESQFAAMVRACHDAGVKVYADAVINHMTGQGSTSYGGRTFSKYDYPGLYSPADFHYHAEDCGNADNLIHDGDYTGSARNVQNCELVGLSDLETEESYVRGAIAGYLNKLIGLGVDGFRIDAAKHTAPGDLANIYGRLSGSPYIYQEVIYGGGEAVQPGQYTGIGDVLEFQYGRYLREKFSGSIADLRTFGESWGGMQPSAKSVTFVANHDTERGTSALSYKDGATYRLANIFQLAWNYGSPQVYDGFTWSDREAGPPHANGFVTDTVCGGGWECLHRDPAITGMVGFHNAVKGTAVANWSAPSGDVIAFSRGAKGWIAINNGEGSHTGTFATGLAAGTYTNLTGGGTVTVNAGGQATVTVPAKGAVAITAGGTGTPGDQATVYYRTSWAAPNLHYGVGGTWTTPPGVAMDSACAGWFRKIVDLGSAAALAVTFNDGSGTWDNNGGRNYALGAGVSTVANGVVTGGAADPCAGASQVPVTFNVTATTSVGTSVFLVGSVPALGSWDTGRAVPLSAAGYPVWSATVTLPAGTAFAYKFVKKDGAGAVTWESGANRTHTTGSSGSTINATWK